MTTDVQPVTLETRLKRSENILFSEIDQDKVMIDIQRGAYFGMNPVAGELWNQLETPRSAVELIRHLLAIYEVDASTCEKETLAVLQRMLRLELVQVVA